MLDTILGWILEHVPFLFLILAIIFVTARITIRWTKYSIRFKSMENACNDVPSINQKITQMEVSFNEIPAMSAKLGTLSTDIRGLIFFLGGKHTDFNSGLFQSHSPVSLTPIGFEVLKQSGGEDYIETNFTALLSEMEKQDFKSGLDVQTYAVTPIIEDFGSDEFIHIRNFLYQNPLYKKDNKEIAPTVSKYVPDDGDIFKRQILPGTSGTGREGIIVSEKTFNISVKR